MKNVDKTWILPIIERLEVMVEKESEHLKKLEKQKRKFLDTNNHDFIYKINEMIDHSDVMLNHYTLRLKEYIEFSKQ